LITKLEHRFVETIPETLEEGILYISTRFCVSMHLCCCGCSNKVVTPLSPVRWKLIFDGKSVSLFPSIGNWNFKCRSHYWINNSMVEWASNLSNEEIVEGKRLKREERARYFAVENSKLKMSIKDTKKKKSFLSTIISRIKEQFN